MAHTSKSAVHSKTTVAEKPLKTVATARKTRAAPRINEVDPGRRQEMIAEAAYLRAERRGFNAGNPTEDWLAAEREVDMLLAEHSTSVTQ